MAGAGLCDIDTMAQEAGGGNRITRSGDGQARACDNRGQARTDFFSRRRVVRDADHDLTSEYIF
jgi:hypothetical protein